LGDVSWDFSDGGRGGQMHQEMIGDFS
jgi:hypothetical protein